MREHFVVSSIHGPEVARAQRSGVLYLEDAFQTLDFGNGLFRVHLPTSIALQPRPFASLRRWLNRSAIQDLVMWEWD